MAWALEAPSKWLILLPLEENYLDVSTDDTFLSILIEHSEYPNGFSKMARLLISATQ